VRENERENERERERARERYDTFETAPQTQVRKVTVVVVTSEYRKDLACGVPTGQN